MIWFCQHGFHITDETIGWNYGQATSCLMMLTPSKSQLMPCRHSSCVPCSNWRWSGNNWHHIPERPATTSIESNEFAQTVNRIGNNWKQWQTKTQWAGKPTKLQKLKFYDSLLCSLLQHSSSDFPRFVPWPKLHWDVWRPANTCTYFVTYTPIPTNICMSCHWPSQTGWV